MRYILYIIILLFLSSCKSDLELSMERGIQLYEWNKVEERYNEKRGLAKGRRLGCQACVQGDVVIDVPAESQVHKQVIRKDASVRPVKMNPATRLYYVEVTEPDMHEPSGDLERLKIAIKDQWEIYDVELDFFQFRKIYILFINYTLSDPIIISQIDE